MVGLAINTSVPPIPVPPPHNEQGDALAHSEQGAVAAAAPHSEQGDAASAGAGAPGGVGGVVDVRG